MKLNNNDDSHNSGLNLLIYNMLLDIESHPAWVCGLKQVNLDRIYTGAQVTPCVGVWIETYERTIPLMVTKVTPCVGVWIETPGAGIIESVEPSHPAWVCGLKLASTEQLTSKVTSHPAWVCGLKPSWEAARAARPVTPCVGVWIETENN